MLLLNSGYFNNIFDTETVNFNMFLKGIIFDSFLVKKNMLLKKICGGGVKSLPRAQFFVVTALIEDIELLMQKKTQKKF